MFGIATFLLAVLSTDTATAPKVEGLIDATTLVEGLQVDLKYSSSDNFMGEDVYGDFDQCMLQRDAAEMLADANTRLRRMRPDLRLLAWDCARPRSVQVRMWALVKGTASQSYVANPHSGVGSIHTYGCAIDLGLATAQGVPVDMGTGYDFFGAKAQPRHEFEHLRRGALKPEQVGARLLLRTVMIEAGFLPLSNEWWHFNCASPAQTRKKYPLIP